MGKYERSEVTRLAIQLWMIQGIDEQKYREAMRQQFPGITTRVLREARADAKLIIAFRKVQNEGD
jgi:hypothetical protein